MKILVSCLFLVFFSRYMHAQDGIYQFELTKVNERQYLKSCLDIDLYSDDFVLPTMRDGEYVKGTKRSSDNKFTILDLYWDEDCLMIPINTYEKNELIKLVKYISVIDEKNILITVSKIN